MDLRPCRHVIGWLKDCLCVRQSWSQRDDSVSIDPHSLPRARAPVRIVVDQSQFHSERYQPVQEARKKECFSAQAICF